MAAPTLEQFRIEPGRDGIVHLVFDAPGRTMNVFSNAAIHELGRFAAWLKSADITGVVARSGKDSAFCAGADLAELGVAYDMIMAAAPADRFQVAFDHFFPLSCAIRALETAGKPVASAIGGLALGGGCELALGTHYRVLSDGPQALFGLPESLVGLLPGGGGTQRVPRLIGVTAALPILLDGARLAGAEAAAAGLADAVVPAGSEVAAAEEWLLTSGQSFQPWDRPGFLAEIDTGALDAARARVLRETLGYYPAPLAILDCIERGLPEPFDAAMQIEMEIFSHLIQRPEPRNMIRTQFLAKLDFDRHRKAGTIPEIVDRAVADIRAAISARGAASDEAALALAGFTRGTMPFAHVPTAQPPLVPRPVENPTYWFEQSGLSKSQRAAASFLFAGAEAATQFLPLDPHLAGIIDHVAVRDLGFPSYLGGPVALADHLAG